MSEVTFKFIRRKPTLKRFINKLLRTPQRMEITSIVGNKVLVVNETYKNKVVVNVSAITLNRCSSKI